MVRSSPDSRCQLRGRERCGASKPTPTKWPNKAASCSRSGSAWREATAEGQEERGKTLEAEIDELLREKEEVAKWATVGLP